MLKLFSEALSLLFTAVYISLRGESQTETIFTGSMFSYVHTYDGGCLKFTSSEFFHLVSFKRWYLPTQTTYTYLIQVNQLEDEKEILLKTLPMPLLCSSKFTGSTLPHRLAVEECLQKLFWSYS